MIKKRLAKTLNKMGNTYNIFHEKRLAIRYLNEALELASTGFVQEPMFLRS